MLAFIKKAIIALLALYGTYFSYTFLRGFVYGVRNPEKVRTPEGKQFVHDVARFKA